MVQSISTTAFVPLSSVSVSPSLLSRPAFSRSNFIALNVDLHEYEDFVSESHTEDCKEEGHNDDIDDIQSDNDDAYEDEVSISQPDQRYTADDWLHNVMTWPKSTILRECRGPIVAVMLWSLFLCVLHEGYHVFGFSAITKTTVLSNLWNLFVIKTMPKTIIPHAATITALSLLLVFRTNSAYSKWAQGRLVWEELLTISRQFTRILYLYPEFDEKRDIMFRLIAAFPYLLHRHVQPVAEYSTAYGTLISSSEDVPLEYRVTIVPSTEASGIQRFPETRAPAYRKQPTRVRRKMDELFQRLPRRRSSKISSIYEVPKVTEYWIDRRNMPWCLFPTEEMSLQLCAHSANRPLWVANRLGQIIAATPFTKTYTSMERERILQYVERLTSVVSQCERIHRTAVPLRYVRHCLRALTLWLWTLPFALLRDFGWITVPAMGGLAFVMYGIYQIGYTIEDPFQGSLRLTNLCDQIFRDVAMFQRNATSATNKIATLQRDRRSIGFQVSLNTSDEWKTLPVNA